MTKQKIGRPSEIGNYGGFSVLRKVIIVEGGSTRSFWLPNGVYLGEVKREENRKGRYGGDTEERFSGNKDLLYGHDPKKDKPPPIASTLCSLKTVHTPEQLDELAEVK